VLRDLPSGVLWSLPALAFGILAAFIDIDSFFRSERLSFTTRRNLRCHSFLVLNGLLSAGFVIWAIESDPKSLINNLVQVEHPAAKMIIIAFAVPLLLRSKLFSFGDNQTPAGPAVAYDWARVKVLYDINMRSAAVKDRLADQYAGTRAGAAGFPAQVKGFVDDDVRPFATPAEKDQLQREFDAIQASHTGASVLSQEHFRQLIRWAMDSTGIRYMKDRLK